MRAEWSASDEGDRVAFRSQVEDFAALYERTYQAVFRTVLGICSDAALAADLAQDTYVLAYRRRASFRGDVPVDAWLHRIAVNTALGGLRKRKVRWVEPLESDRHERPKRMPDPGDALDVRGALARLEPKARAAVVLRYYHDYDYATIASILGTSTGTIGSLLSRSLDRMRRDLAFAAPPEPVVSSTSAPTTVALGEEAAHGG
jgi:RNA polymerase sigma-70 factor (ECF subfamily)